MPGPTNGAGSQEPWLDRLAGLPTDSKVPKIMESLNKFRETMGRPQDTYGVTPLVIFRQIGQRDT